MSAASHSTAKEAPYYYVPADSSRPASASASLLVMMLGASAWVNDYTLGKWAVYAGLLSLLVVLYFWFSDAIRESLSGLNSKRVDLSYRWSMSWFIFSEVMFFAAFFGSLWYIRTVTTPWLGDLDHKMLLWPEFNAVWPNMGPAGIIENFEVMGPFWLPTINTALLLSSGVTLTFAHHALRANTSSCKFCKVGNCLTSASMICGVCVSFWVFRVFVNADKGAIFKVGSAFNSNKRGT